MPWLRNTERRDPSNIGAAYDLCGGAVAQTPGHLLRSPIAMGSWLVYQIGWSDGLFLAVPSWTPH
jgi:hypothetical protein